MVWYGPTSETVWMQKRLKNWLKYTDFAELKKITNRIYSNCSNYYSLFSQVLQISLLFILFDLKKNLQLLVKVCCLFYFFLHSIFFKGKVKGVFGGFYRFFSSGFYFKKNGCFLGWVQLHQP